MNSFGMTSVGMDGPGDPGPDGITELVVADIGGTNARFALATIGADASIALGEPVNLPTSGFVSLLTAWEEFARRVGRTLPRNASVAIAAPVTGEVIRMTNNSWTFDTARLDTQLGLDRALVLNDFAAVANAAARCRPDDFIHLCGPQTPLPPFGTITVVGPGTGLGIAHFHRYADGPGGLDAYHVQATEGGHMDFGPVDRVDDALLAHLRARHRRVSVERVAAGPGIADIYQVLAQFEGRSVEPLDDKAVWIAAAERSDALAIAAVERFCMILGSVAGDYALAQGAVGVVVAGGIVQRIRDTLLSSAFATRFRFKGRYEQLMTSLPVKLITHPQPGLFGAAAAFAMEMRRAAARGRAA